MMTRYMHLLETHDKKIGIYDENNDLVSELPRNVLYATSEYFRTRENQLGIDDKTKLNLPFEKKIVELFCEWQTDVLSENVDGYQNKYDIDTGTKIIHLFEYVCYDPVFMSNYMSTQYDFANKSGLEVNNFKLELQYKKYGKIFDPFYLLYLNDKMGLSKNTIDLIHKNIKKRGKNIHGFFNKTYIDSNMSDEKYLSFLQINKFDFVTQIVNLYKSNNLYDEEYISHLIYHFINRIPTNFMDKLLYDHIRNVTGFSPNILRDNIPDYKYSFTKNPASCYIKLSPVIEFFVVSEMGYGGIKRKISHSLGEKKKLMIKLLIATDEYESEKEIDIYDRLDKYNDCEWIYGLHGNLNVIGIEIKEIIEISFDDISKILFQEILSELSTINGVEEKMMSIEKISGEWKYILSSKTLEDHRITNIPIYMCNPNSVYMYIIVIFFTAYVAKETLLIK